MSRSGSWALKPPGLPTAPSALGARIVIDTLGGPLDATCFTVYIVSVRPSFQHFPCLLFSHTLGSEAS